jgi:hypothetical protein
MAKYQNIKITEEFLDQNPDSYFIFGDNLERYGHGGAAILRDHCRAIGFITKKFPDNKDESFYKPDEYSPIFFEELKKLKTIILEKPNKIFYVSQLGGGLANRYKIWEKLIRHNVVRQLSEFNNVIFCWSANLL